MASVCRVTTAQSVSLGAPRIDAFLISISTSMVRCHDLCAVNVLLNRLVAGCRLDHALSQARFRVPAVIAVNLI